MKACFMALNDNKCHNKVSIATLVTFSFNHSPSGYFIYDIRLHSVAKHFKMQTYSTKPLMVKPK